MIERPGLLWRAFFAIVFSLKHWREEEETALREAADRGQVVYVGSHRHLWNALYFNRVFSRLGLPLARVVLGIFTATFQRITVLLAQLFAWRPGRKHEVLRARWDEALARGESTMLFLRAGWRPGKAGEQPHSTEMLEATVRAQRASDRPIILMPLQLFWGHYPLRPGKSGRNWFRKIFGGPEDPGAIRSFWYLFRFFRQQWVRLAEPIDLQALLADHPDRTDAELAAELRRTLWHRLEEVRRVLQGPRRKGVRRIREEVLHSDALQQAITAISAGDDVPRDKMVRTAQRYLKEIAADPQPDILIFLRWSLRFLWFRVYSGIEVDEAGMAELREASQRGPLLFLPSHRSHVDYLVLSWIVSAHGVAPPCIAAGRNLSFWPLGPVFRRSGAFFIRRSFRDDRLYTACLSEYLRHILAERYNVEFFIEGTRSRTGKMLMPRLGLLKWIAEAVVSGRLEGVQIAPLAIGYEKVIEEGSYARELAGDAAQEEKQPDKGVVRRLLRSRFGRLNIQVQKPYDLAEALADAGAPAASPRAGDEEREMDQEALAKATERLGRRIAYEIAHAAAVTPRMVVSTALLFGGQDTVTRQEVNERAQLIHERLAASGARFAKALVADQGGVRGEAVDEALLLLADDRLIGISGPRIGRFYIVRAESRRRLAYYRNGLINVLAPEAILLCALRRARREAAAGIAPEDLTRKHTQALARLFKNEFLFAPGFAFPQAFAAAAEKLRGWALHDDPSGLRLAPETQPAIDLIVDLLRDFLEAYHVATLALPSLLSGPMGRRRLLKRIYDAGERADYRRELARREACSKVNYTNAVQTFIDLGVVTETVGKSRHGPPLALTEAYASADALAALTADIEAFLEPSP